MLRITEIFHSIQGESTHAGRRCAFVRLAGCNLRCTWCDSAYTFTGGEKMSLDEVLAKVSSFGCELVEVTGGEPLAQPECLELIRALCDAGYEVLVETSGSIDIDPIDRRAKLILDVKCPGSGEVERNHWPNLDKLMPHDEVKFVVADRSDYEWARELVASRGLARSNSVLFSPVWGALGLKELAAW
ncbi:MAG: radical SAM protein, partial [Thermoanaerobaculia bacterium]|nr:radical SAM protein [Thermoanaerobaculia bacterium]